MSIEPEDSVFEEALRGDLPSRDTEARLRRRLIAAGVAVGNGIATTAAAGTASGAATTGVLAKVIGASWGIKLGFAAVVAIPAVGLWVDARKSAPSVPAQTAMVAPARPQLDVAPAHVASAPVLAAEGTEASSPEPERPAPKSAKVSPADAPAIGNSASTTTHPSQADFGVPEGSPRAPQVASTLAEETRLLDGAFAALTAGNLSRAAQLIHEHEVSYPSGLLTKERERAKTRLSELSRGE
jgi:hypothetical protein